MIGCFGLGGLLDRLQPWPLLASFEGIDAARSVGLALLALGVALDVWSLGLFRRAGTSALPFLPASARVESGPYRFTRNPMYLGMTLSLAGVGLALNRGWILLAAPLAAAILDRYAIAREERYLERRFGDAYRDYKRRVRRWL
ncbi:MAG TPA: isoprenylcysteine carboxylmethyltransferase family protein [Thermoanaerobaculia bacterium]|nr:isoprenylcysteine carboxylmethyltransferase family protein [Thermoanaerobaculia bacterium]